jgi:hypothetical protein
MANTTRQNILDAIKTLLEAVVDADGATVFKDVSIGKEAITEIENKSLPCCFIWSDRETRFTEGEETVIGKEAWEWIVVIEVWALDKEMESLLNYIHTAMYNNYKFTNYAEYSERWGVDFFNIDPEKRLEIMLVPYRVIYRHTLGTM